MSRPARRPVEPGFERIKIRGDVQRRSAQSAVMPLEKPKESDWKRFRAIVPALRERYLAKKNQTIGELWARPDAARRSVFGTFTISCSKRRRRFGRVSTATRDPR